MNSSYYPILIALFYLAVHVFSAIAKESAKRKLKQRQMAQDEQRRMAGSRMDTPPAQTATNQPVEIRPVERQTAIRTGTPPTMSRGGKFLEDLATKRKQQLDQLRDRMKQQPTARADRRNEQARRERQAIDRNQPSPAHTADQRNQPPRAPRQQSSQRVQPTSPRREPETSPESAIAADVPVTRSSAVAGPS